MKRIAIVCSLHLTLLAAQGCSAHKALMSGDLARVTVLDPARQAQEDRVRAIVGSLPAYEADSLARYERNEILAVTADIDELFNPLTPHSFAENFQQLDSDWERLVALDQILQKQEIG